MFFFSQCPQERQAMIQRQQNTTGGQQMLGSNIAMANNAQFGGVKVEQNDDKKVFKNQQKEEQQQPKPDELGDADEAIDALFGGGRNLLSDDLMRDLMDADMMAQDEYEEEEEREQQINPDEDESKLNELLSAEPLFNLDDDVADLMKSLPDETLEHGLSSFSGAESRPANPAGENSL